MIDYGVCMFHGGDRILTRFHEHCFGNLQHFPRLQWGNNLTQCRGISGTAEVSAFRNNNSSIDLCDTIDYICLFVDEHAEGTGWDTEEEYLANAVKITSTIPWLAKDMSIIGNEVRMYINSDTTWDEAILKLTFMRNILYYNATMFQTARRYGLNHAHSAFIAQIFNPSSSGTKFYVNNDEEYSWLCAASFGEEAFSDLLSPAGPTDYSQKKIRGGGDGGYKRDEEYAEDGEIFNEDAYDGGDWDDHGENYYMMLCRVFCIPGDSPLPFVENYISEGVTTIKNNNGITTGNLLTGYNNWLYTKGFK